jgi:uncharacterized membrane protein YciS (DUF1049 family)
MDLNANDKRFVREWEIQTKGSRRGYFLLHTATWAIIFFFLQIAARYIITEFRSTVVFTVYSILFVILIGWIVAGFLYYRSQTRYLEIKLRQKEEETQTSGEKTGP